MQRFHRNLYKERMEKAQALRAAQQWVRELTPDAISEIMEARVDNPSQSIRDRIFMSAAAVIKTSNKLNEDRPFSNPCWWAAFQCVGAGWGNAGKVLRTHLFAHYR